jgi:sugar phosphate isomerase/epimerase
MGFRSLELGLSETPPSMDGLDDSRRETGVAISSLVAGCRDPLNGSMAFEHLGSLQREEGERAINSIRRHVRLAKAWGARTVVIRGTTMEDSKLRKEADLLQQRINKEELDAELKEAIRVFVKKAQRASQRQIEQLCRAVHTLSKEEPEMNFAIEPGREIDDLLGHDAMGWALGDLALPNVGYWHDVGRIHMREKVGLPTQGDWLQSFASRMLGVHLQDAAETEAEMPIGAGEVDFKLISEYVPRTAERVVEIGPRHGRAEILASVQFLVDLGI